MKALRDTLIDLEGDQPSKWKETAVSRRENRARLNNSVAIALKVLDALQAKGY